MAINKGDKVVLEYEGKLENGEVFDSSERAGQPLEFTAGEGKVIKGFDDAVIGMKKGEEKEFSIKPEEAYGPIRDELKKEVIEAYTSQNPTPENTTEIIEELATQFDKTVNGVRMMLSKAEVYVSKTPASSSSGSGAAKTPRKSKQESLDELPIYFARNTDELKTQTQKLVKRFGKVIVAFSLMTCQILEVERIISILKKKLVDQK